MRPHCLHAFPACSFCQLCKLPTFMPLYALCLPAMLVYVGGGVLLLLPAYLPCLHMPCGGINSLPVAVDWRRAGSPLTLSSSCHASSSSLHATCHHTTLLQMLSVCVCPSCLLLFWDLPCYYSQHAFSHAGEEQKRRRDLLLVIACTQFACLQCLGWTAGTGMAWLWAGGERRKDQEESRKGLLYFIFNFYFYLTNNYYNSIPIYSIPYTLLLDRIIDRTFGLGHLGLFGGLWDYTGLDYRGGEDMGDSFCCKPLLEGGSGGTVEREANSQQS